MSVNTFDIYFRCFIMISSFTSLILEGTVSSLFPEAREMKDIDCNKCRFECSLNVDEDNRRRIFQEYWGLKSYDRQRDFICSHVLQGELFSWRNRNVTLFS
jgi:hypothetical protein